MGFVNCCTAEIQLSKVDMSRFIDVTSTEEAEYIVAEQIYLELEKIMIQIEDQKKMNWYKL